MDLKDNVKQELLKSSVANEEESMDSTIKTPPTINTREKRSVT